MVETIKVTILTIPAGLPLGKKWDLCLCCAVSGWGAELLPSVSTVNKKIVTAGKN